MGTFSPWFSGTPSYSAYSDMGSDLGGRPRSIKQVQQRQDSSPVAMPHNTTTVINQQAPQQRQRPQQNMLSNIKGLAEMVKKFTTSDVTGTGPSTPGYSLGMDVSGDSAIIAADAAEATGLPVETAPVAGVVEPFNYVPGVAESGPGFISYMAPVGAGIAGGKVGGYFGNWAGEQLGIGGKKERDTVGGVLGGATAGATAGAAAGGIGAIPGALLGGAVGGLGKFFSIF